MLVTFKPFDGFDGFFFLFVFVFLVKVGEKKEEKKSLGLEVLNKGRGVLDRVQSGTINFFLGLTIRLYQPLHFSAAIPKTIPQATLAAALNSRFPLLSLTFLSSSDCRAS